MYISNGRFHGLNPYEWQPIIWIKGILTMENTMEQIRTRLKKGESPQELIKKGFKRTTVYSVAKKMERKLEENNNEKATDSDIFLALIIKEAVGQILFMDLNLDSEEEVKRWESIIEIADGRFEELLGRKPPKDFLTPTFRTP